MIPSLVVLDLAGTTIEDDDVVARCLVEAVGAVGRAVSREDANAVMGLSKPAAIARLLGGVGTDDRRVASAAGLFERSIVRHYRSPGAVVPIRGAEETLDALRLHGAKIAIDTGFSAVVADAVLERLGWMDEGLVDARVASDEVARGRPAPDMVREAMRRCGVADARAVAKVGDTPADLGEGASAGCGWIVGVTYGTHPRESLERHPHTALIDDLRDLPAALGVEDAGPPRRPSRPRPLRRL